MKEENLSFDPALTLSFSEDTVSFDTLLSERRSNTKRLMVYNRNGSAIRLSEISLGKGSVSDYSVIINGRESSRLINEEIAGGDSLLILIEVNVSTRDRDQIYLARDSMIFRWNTNESHVKLISYAQDANELGNGLVQICDEIWTNNRPYIISDTVLVTSGCTLTIQKGTSIYFENNAALFIQGQMEAIGDSANQIFFRNTRFDGIFDRTPGQWNGIYFLEGSTENKVHYAQIFNGQVGLRLGTPDDDGLPDVSVSNTKIYNMSRAGILAFTSDLEVENTLIHSCGEYLMGGFAGGNYSFVHCTFSNSPALFIQDQPTVQFSDNIVIGDDELLISDLSLDLTNCIVWGEGGEELLINNGGGTDLEVNLLTNIIKSSQEIPGNFTSQDRNFPGFRAPNFQFDFTLDTLAFAIDRGTPTDIRKDIEGETRDMKPDIGAYERKKK